MNKFCNGCNTEYPATTEYFHKCSNENDGLRYVCKKCRKEDSKKYYDLNRDSEILKAKNVYKRCINEKKIYNQEYRKANRTKILNVKKKYCKDAKG